MIQPGHEEYKVLCSLCTFRNQFLTGNFSYSIIKPLVGCSKKKEATLKCDPRLPKWLHQPVQTSKIQKEITAAFRMLEYICSDKSHAKANLKSKSVKCKKKKKSGNKFLLLLFPTTAFHTQAYVTYRTGCMLLKQHLSC